MKINVNGEQQEVTAPGLDAVLLELGYGEAKVATAVNEEFVPTGARATVVLQPGDRLEIVAPRQGG